MLRRVEQALQSAIEKPFGRLFPQKLQPSEMKAALREAMENSALAAADGPYVANSYAVGLSLDDYQKISAVGSVLERELAAYLQQYAAEARLICGPYLGVTVSVGEGVPAGQMLVQADFGERRPAYLQAEAGLPDRDKQVALGDTSVIGRGTDGDVVIGDEAVSRRHCEIVWHYVQYVVRDMNSANGTFVNGQQMQAAPLRDGDLLEVGLVQLRFHDGPVAASAVRG